MSTNVTQLGGGALITKKGFPTEVIPSGATGTIKTITPDPGTRVILTGLGSLTASQTNLTSIDVNSVTVVSAVNLQDIDSNADASNEFYIGFDRPNSGPIVGDIDEVFEITTNVATSQSTAISWQYST